MIEDQTDIIGTNVPGGRYYIVQEGEPEYELVKASIEKRSKKEAFMASVRGILWGQVPEAGPIIKQLEHLYDSQFQ